MAVLVTFEVRTRVIIDVDSANYDDFTEDEYSDGIEKAIEKIASNPRGYLCEDNVSDFSEDTEVPYGKELEW